MKKVILILAVFLGLTACDNGFEELNVNPNAVDALAPGPKLSSALLKTAGDRFENWRGNIIYSSYIIQHMANPGGLGAGDRYEYNAQWSGAWFERGYGSHVNAIEDLLYQLTVTDAGVYPEEMTAITRILRVFVYHKITDLYGDVPYSQAGRGFSDGIFRPAYDPQSEIYADMLNELSEATATLSSGTSEFGSADIMFNGDLGKWKRFGNSLMLRLGMRLVKVDPTAAQSWAQQAINGGLMESNDDIAFIQHAAGPQGINQNGNGQVFQADDSMRLSEVFIAALQDDPRMRIYAALPDANGNSSSGSNDPALQLGLPNGLFGADIPADLSIYSEPNRNLITGVDDPYFFMSYAEVEYLQAEANVRWGIGGPAATHYSNGVTAAMRQLDLYNIGGESITDAEISNYLTANPYNPADALNQINTEFWIATFLNDIESFANWRRTGFPVLTATSAPTNQSNGEIPRRLRYFEREQLVNLENYQEAVNRQGPDEFFTRMWWDVE